MRFTLPAMAILVSTAIANPTPSIPSTSELTALAERIADGAPVPEGVTMLDRRSAEEEALQTLEKRGTYCGAKSNGTCCCSICSTGRVTMCTLSCGTTVGCAD